jgi:glycoside/pentoside/hexuronide:cation symporter, GPH family
LEPESPPTRADETPATGRVPLATKIAAGSGEAAINIGINLPKNFAFPIYNIALGVSPTLLGIALFVPRLWDALIDPVMGNISDNSKNRFGRRRPYMLVGAVLSAIGIALLCIFPRGLNEGEWGSSVIRLLGIAAPRGDWLYAGWLMVMSILFYTAMTVFAVPYGALTMELTRDYEERTRVMSFRTLFTYLSGFLMAWLYAIAEWDVFKDAAGQKDVVKGSYAVGGLLVIVMLVVTLVPTLFVKEPKQVVTRSKRAVPAMGFWAGLRETLSERAFILIVSAYTIGFLGVIMVIGLGLYLTIYRVYGGDRGTGSVVQGWSQTLAVCTGIVTVILINRLSGRVEKKVLLIGALCCSFVGGLLSWVLYSPDLPTWNLLAWLPGERRWPFHPLAFSHALIWPGLAGLLVMSNSMIADICDIDELRTGQRREGMYWAVFNWIQKSAISIALLFSGVVLDLAGFDASMPAQTPEAIQNLRVAYMSVVCGGVGLAAVLFIPINRRRLEHVHHQLAANRMGDAREERA